MLCSISQSNDYNTIIGSKVSIQCYSKLIKLDCFKNVIYRGLFITVSLLCEEECREWKILSKIIEETLMCTGIFVSKGKHN